MSRTRTEIDCVEESTFPVTSTFTSDGSTAIASADIVSMTMTLIDEVTGDTINSRSAQDVFGANDCTYHATSGLFTWNVQTEDTTIQNTSTPIGRRENHLATVTVVFDTDKIHTFEVLLMVKNLRGVT